MKDQLKSVSERLESMTRHPSALTRDALLAELRTLYDTVLGLDITQQMLDVEEAPSPDELTTKAPADPVIVPDPVRSDQSQNNEPSCKNSLNNVNMGGLDDHILAGKLNHTPLRDLRSGIPMNDKFGIIKNLFDGKATEFGDAIIHLNDAGSAAEMNSLLRQLADRHGWDEDADSYKLFVGYVSRRMMAATGSHPDTDQ